MKTKLEIQHCIEQMELDKKHLEESPEYSITSKIQEKITFFEDSIRALKWVLEELG